MSVAPLPGLAEAVLGKLESGVLVLDAQKRVVLLNAWLRRAMPAAPAAPEGMALTDLFPEVRGTRLEQAVGLALSRGLPSVLSPGLNPHHLRLHDPGHADHAPMAQSLQVMPLKLAGHALCLVAVNNVSGSMRRESLLREQAEKLGALSLTDELTGVANRRRLNQALDDELRRARRHGHALAVALLDIDHFKAYNDHLGHLAGDQALARVGDELHGQLRRAGDLLARYGGEEFCVLLPETAEAEALAYVEALRRHVEAIALPHPASPTAPVLTISVGVAACGPAGACSATSLLLQADRALYEAKLAGRNRIRAVSGATPAG